MERRVVLLSRDPQLAAVSNRLLANGDRIEQYRSAPELADWSQPEVAAVILDSQPQARRLAYKQVRDRYAGPLIMLLDQNEPRPDLPPDGARHFVHRPFKIADLSRLLDGPAPGLEPFEAAVIGAWSRHATVEPPVPTQRGPSYRVSYRQSPRRRLRAWAASLVALVGLLLVVSVSDQGSCAAGCTSFGGAVAGAAENPTPPISAPAPAAGGAGAAQPPAGSGAASSLPPTPTGLPPIAGVDGLIESINPISPDDTTPPSGPEHIPGVPAPPGPRPPLDSSPPPSTDPAPPTTAPPTTVPPTTAPPTTAPPTTAPPTTAPPTTEPPTTAPPTTAPPTTAPPTTEPPTTAAPTTAATTAAAPTTTVAQLTTAAAPT